MRIARGALRALRSASVRRRVRRRAALFRQYEYEEEMYLSLDGTATVYVNSSIAGAERAARHVVRHRARRRASTATRSARTSPTPVTRVIRVSQSRRSNRRFVHVRLDVDDVARLGEAPPFAWSTYQFTRDGDLFVYQQTVGAAAGKEVGDVGWNGSEIVAFRLHLPSKIVYHNTGATIRSAATSWSGSSRSPIGCAATPLRARRADGAAVDPLPHAVAVRRDVRGRRGRHSCWSLAGC